MLKNYNIIIFDFQEIYLLEFPQNFVICPMKNLYNRIDCIFLEIH